MKQKNKIDLVKLILLLLVFYRFLGTGDCQASQLGYYGDWRVDNVIGFAHISEGPELAAKEYVGKVLVYHSDYAEDSNSIRVNPIYFEQKYSEEEFYKYNRASLKTLGINSGFIYFIKVAGKGEGSSFYYVAESDTLIVRHEGVFLASVRISE